MRRWIIVFVSDGEGKIFIQMDNYRLNFKMVLKYLKVVNSLGYFEFFFLICGGVVVSYKGRVSFCLM